MNLPYLSNSAVPIERSQLEQLLESMAAMQHLTAQIAASLLEKLDDIDGDPDAESNGDEKDCAWIEWDKMPPSMKAVRNVIGVNNEDAEDDDPKEEDDHSGQNTEDEISAGLYSFGYSPDRGPGCAISDPGGCDLER